jgi:phosphopantothenoylcysteine decarboxylase / phosphopantothenate---cysteine ligase
MLGGKRILLGVTGGIAAYKACELARLLIREGANVQAVLTPRAAQFVTPLTFAALTGQAAPVEEFPASPGSGELPGDVYAHLNLTRGIDCFVISPATANTLAKLAAGLADNLVTGSYLSCTAPVVLAPAMNTRMWQHPATQENIAKLQARGHVIVNPGTGELACGDTGAGRLAALEDIFAAIAEVCLAEGANFATAAPPGTIACQSDLSASRDLYGRTVIVTAGGTREYLDPVRFITNASSGRLGLNVVSELARRGAKIVLLDTGIEVPPSIESQLAGREVVRTAFDLQREITVRFPHADGLVMLAAVADYSPARYESHKRKKDGTVWTVELSETTDILAQACAARKPGQVLVGVSLEDTDWLERAQRKAASKGADALLAVELGADLPFGPRQLTCALVAGDRILAGPARRDKSDAARLIGDFLAGSFAARASNVS